MKVLGMARFLAEAGVVIDQKTRQQLIPPEMLGVAPSAVSFFRSLVGAFGVALSVAC
jgi:hypothetical protein